MDYRDDTIPPFSCGAVSLITFQFPGGGASQQIKRYIGHSNKQPATGDCHICNVEFGHLEN